MNTNLQRLVVILAIAWITLPDILKAEGTDATADKTLAPYFFINSNDPNTDRLPLKSTTVETTIVGVLADVVVRQTYKNEGTRAIEAQYVFPGSTRAAVYGLVLHVGERTIEAKVREKNQARIEYTQAKNEGKSAALLEQERPNVFQMNVANILPKDEIKVELRYTELLVPTDGVYQFVYPTVVGPRYSTQPAATAPAAEKWIANPYLQQNKEPTSTFSFKMTLNSGIPIQDVTSLSHQIDVHFAGTQSAIVTLATTGHNENNRDIIINYRFAGEKIASGVMLYKGDKESFFLAMVEPPARVTPASIPPREYIFVLDVSGSMSGFPLQTAQTLLRNLVGGLKPNDTFNVLMFAGASRLLANQSLLANQVSIDKAIHVIDNEQGGGGTNLLPALQQALAIPVDKIRARSLIIVTDGYVDVETATFDLIRTNLNKGNVFAFGIGSSVNRFLIEGIAHAGQGEPFIVDNPVRAPAEAERFRRYVEAPVLTKVNYTFTGFQAYDIRPITLPDLLAQRPLLLFGKWRGKQAGTLFVTGTSGDGPFTKSFDLSQINATADNAALRYLWARRCIADLADYEAVEKNSERQREITSLGITYNLLTEYTSFVAIDNVVRNTLPQEQISVPQPLPMPQGVSNTAVGNSWSIFPSSSSPEPETWLLFSTAGLVLAWANRRKVRRG